MAAMAPDAVELRVLRRRWAVLAAFCLVSMMNAFQWVQYSIISDSVERYYGVATQAVDWTSMIYMVMYVPFILPASWMLDKEGLRRTVLLAAALNCLAAWIKVAAVGRPDLFAVILVGQAVAAVTQAFVLAVPARLAAVWFGADQVSTACAIGVFGNQVGNAVGFAVPHWLVRSTSSGEQLGAELNTVSYGVAAVSTLALVLVVLVFQDAPPVPPSRAQAAQLAKAVESAPPSGFADGVLVFLRSIRETVAMPGFVLLFVSYGVSVGVFYALSTVLNRMVLSVFPGSEDAGNIGLVVVLTGLLGSVLCGVLLDATAKFKEVTLAVYFLSLVGMAGFALAFLTSTMWVVYVASAFLGFFLTGYLPLGFELAVELTYPQPEGTSAGLLNASAQVFGVLFTELSGVVLDLGDDGYLWANVLLCAALLLGTALTALIPKHLRRQDAQRGPEQHGAQAAQAATKSPPV